MRYYNLLCCILIPFFLMAQNNNGQKIVKGRIVDAATGKLMAGASLQMKLSGGHSYSGYDGLFSVTASSLPDSLIVTFVGYQRLTIPISGTAVFLELQMRAEAGTLQEVSVFTGYQVIPKERATGSFSTVDLKTFNEQVSRNVLDRLEAVANGFSIDKYTGVSSGTQNIMIRGQTTILGVKGPLIVVDNFPYNGDLKNINPNDVENITILRDAAAASIWGTKAGNGVIVITTKKGRFNQPLRVDFNSNISFTAKPDLFSLPQMSSGEYIDLEQNLFDKKYKVGDVSNINQPPFSPVYEILFKKLNGALSSEEVRIQLDSYRSNDYRNDLNKYFYQTAVGQQYALSARGGSSAYSWLFSAGYDQNISELAAKDNRLNVQLSNSWKASERLQISASLYLTKSKAGNGKPGYFDLKTANGNLPPYTRLADEFGQKLAVIKDYRQSFLDGISNHKLLDWNYYPLDDYTHNIIEN
ncbi:TonB-dependent receptor plug domain-containing protein, partial [Pedobacter sp.]|uniref:TonB-dependent receptor plug domain-containing protein n=1 Tax=Pedobacter sp. TaxID=1411316 RepID=UPI002B9D25AA